jgi:HK97 family phage portal protein
MSIFSEIASSVTGFIKEARLPAPSGPDSTGKNPFDGINNPAPGMQFNSVGDFLKYMKSDAFNIAYKQLDPFSCYVLAFSNDRVMSTITAIARPISAAEYVATPKNPDKPNQIELDYLNELLSDPNPDLFSKNDYNYNVNNVTEYDQSPEDYQFAMALDLLISGNNYEEISYNRIGKPAARYRHPPYMIDIVNGRYVHRNGYVFKRGEIIHNKYFNPFSNKIGMSPLVPLVAAVMLDSSILQKNIKNFSNDALKGIINLDPAIPVDKAQEQLDKVKKQIKDMKKSGRSGHLVTYAAAFQAISATNKDMLTPEVEKTIFDRIIAIYGVPPAEVMKIESGNIGGGTGESQKETLYESVNFWNKKILLGSYKRQLIRYAGLKDTTVSVKGLTVVDERKQLEINRGYLDSGVTDIDEVRVDLGKEPYGEPWSQKPTMASPRVPADMIGQQNFLQPQESASGISNESAIKRLKEMEQNIQDILDN